MNLPIRQTAGGRAPVELVCVRVARQQVSLIGEPVSLFPSSPASPGPRYGTSSPASTPSLYEVARALHITNTRRAAVVTWFNQFAARPRDRA